jgi:hypothetical protein
MVSVNCGESHVASLEQIIPVNLNHAIRCALLLRRLLLGDVITNVDLISDVLPFGRLCLGFSNQAE